MKYLFKLALKNIMKARRRTILTFLMLSFGVMVYLIMESMLAGFDKASFQNFIDFETGHFKIRNENFDEDHPYDTDYSLKNTDQIEEKLKNLDFVTGYTSRINFLSEIDNGIDSTPVITVGVDPENDSKVFSLKKYIIKGSLEKGGALLGKTLADDMKVDAGDIIYITFRSSKGMFTSIELLITGLVQSADPKVNNLTVFINLDEAREHMGVEGATEITFRVKDYQEPERYTKQLESDFSGFRVQSWKELSTDFTALMSTKRAGGRYFLLFIVVIALVGIINTLLMSVYEKRREIGTLMALGMEHNEIRNVFMIEGFLIGFFGSICGLIIGTITNLYFIYSGIDYTAMVGEGGMGFNVMGVIKSSWVISAYISSLLIVVFASVLSSYYPAKKVMKMNPAECLRTVQ
ncbi:MAG: ABC transporter permease [Spirochaetes bacterium]|nr:ABC transporter permease [Spirochaetota bacterium]